MTQLDRIEAMARKLAPADTRTAGSQLDRIGQYLGAAIRSRPSSTEFLPGTGRLGGQGHDLGDPTPVADLATVQALKADAKARLAEAAARRTEAQNPPASPTTKDPA